MFVILKIIIKLIRDVGVMYYHLKNKKKKKNHKQTQQNKKKKHKEKKKNGSQKLQLDYQMKKRIP